MVLRLRQHNIGYTADGFNRSDDPTNSVKALKGGKKTYILTFVVCMYTHYILTLYCFFGCLNYTEFIKLLLHFIRFDYFCSFTGKIENKFNF